MNARRRHPAPDRGGFTLIELLVVIAIIAVLMSLAVVAFFQYITTQQSSTTETTLQTVSGVLRQHWDQVVNDAKKETGIPQTVVTFAGGDMNRAKVIWIKVRLMEAFPMSYAEINSPVPYSQGWIPTPKQHYNNTYKKALAGKTSANKPATESAACLLLALSISHGSARPLDIDRVSTADTDGDGLKELVDAWNNPVSFYRFPTPGASSDLQAANPAPNAKSADPLDPNGTLVNLASWTKPLQKQYQQQIHPISSNGKAPTYYTIPVIVSWGPNEQLGLDPKTMAVTNQNDANDNIYSYQLRGGKKS